VACPADDLTSVPFGRRRGEGEAIAAAGLLDQGRVTQGLENARAVTSHVIGDGQNKASSQLSKRRTRAGKGRRVGKNFLPTSKR